MKINYADNCEIFLFHLDETKHPIAFANKLKCLMDSGMSETQARHEIFTVPFEMEIYYEIGSGLMAVESEAVECGIYSPYSGKPYEMPDEYNETHATNVPIVESTRDKNAAKYLCDDDEYSIEEMIALAEAHPYPCDLLSDVDGVTVWEPLENTLSVKQFLDSI